MSSRIVQWATLWTLAGLVLSTGGCNSGGGGSSDSPARPAAATVIDLAPGQTTATLGWEASIGSPTHYVVMESRNGRDYVAQADTNQTSYLIRGTGGDDVQIYVIAVGANGSASAPSSPSAILRFHDAPGSAAAAQASPASGGGAVAIESTPNSSDENALATSEASADALPGEAQELASNSTGEATGETRDESAGLSLAAAAQEQLLRADARLPVIGLSQDAEAWLHARADEQLVAGLDFAGTGRLDPDGLSELIWKDPAGQLFVANGAQLLASGDLESTLEAAIRLHATERFVGLADFDGDGRGDWLIEDTATGEIWLVDDASGEARPVWGEPSGDAGAGEASSIPVQLVGHGDFDGDGRTELLWQREDGSLHLGSSDGEDAAQMAIPLPSIPAERLLLVADLDGDGRDDLLARGEDDRLELTLIVSDDSGGAPGVGLLSSETLAGPELDIAGLELVASLDLDGDGRAEVAWLDGETLVIWDPLEDAALED